MHGNHFVKFRQRIFLHRNHWTVVPGVVHENIDRAEFPLSCRHDPFAIVWPREVRCGVAGAPAVPGNFFGGRSEFLFRARREKHRRAFFGKQLRNGAADSAPRTGDKGNLVFEQHRDNENSKEAGTEARRQPRAAS